MKHVSNLAKKATVLFSLLLFSACSSSKIIETQPPGARVYIEGEFVGTTPYELKDRRVFWQKTRVRVKKDGYFPEECIASRSETLNPGAFIGGFLFWPTFLWAGAYEPETVIYLSPNEEANQWVADTAIPAAPKPPKTIAERRAVVERMYESGALTKQEYKTEMEWLDELEREEKGGNPGP